MPEASGGPCTAAACKSSRRRKKGAEDQALGRSRGGLLGAWAVHRVNETLLRIAIVCIGLALTVALFVKPV
jgi:hypothetical protein